MARVYGLFDCRSHPARLIADLTVNLPDGSCIWQALDTPRAWTAETHLLATLIDQMNAWIWGNSDKSKRGARPKPVPRPGQKRQQSENGTVRRIRPMAMSVEEMDAFLGGQFKDLESKTHTPEVED